MLENKRNYFDKEPDESDEVISPKVIARRVVKPELMPDTVLLVGPCRTGTTLHLRVFGNAGIASFNNPLKSAMRRELQRQPGDFVIPDASERPIILDKESIGAATKFESLLNPLAVYDEAQVQSERIRLIVTCREPLAALTSWKTTYKDKTDPVTLTENFILACKTVQSVLSQALQRGIVTTVFPYEVLRDHSPEVDRYPLN